MEGGILKHITQTVWQNSGESIIMLSPEFQRLNSFPQKCRSTNYRKYLIVSFYFSEQKIFKGGKIVNKLQNLVKDYTVITLSTLFMALGVYYFKFPNNFTFGGLTGLCVVLSRVLLISPSDINLVLNCILILLGFAFLGKSFGIRTIYASTLLSCLIFLFDNFFPLKISLTKEPLLDLIFAILLPAAGSAVLFCTGASSGGTDIIAKIMKKYIGLNMGYALLFSDFVITLSAFFVFDINTALYSCLGLVMKSLVIGNIMENINLCKSFYIVCNEYDKICNYIINQLHRSATVINAQGAYSNRSNYIVFTVLKKHQAILLCRFIKNNRLNSFVLVANTNQIIGNGFFN